MRKLTAADNVACQAFALCDRAAEGAVKHPILTAYLSCARCAEKLEADLIEATVTETAEGLEIMV